MKENDIVLLKYNNIIGKIQTIHGSYKPLYDIRGSDGFLYPNQYANEIRKININQKSLNVIQDWLKHLI